MPLPLLHPLSSSDGYWGRQERIVNNNLSDIKGPDSGAEEAQRGAKIQK